MNVYSDSSHMALKYLKDTEVNIDNVIVMTRDFNIRDSLWNSSFPHHSSISDDLMIIADSFNLVLLTSINPCPTRYSDTAGEANSVINLMFLWYRSTKINQHSIYPNCCLSSNYVPSPSPYLLSMKLLTLQNYQFNKTANKKLLLLKRLYRSSRI